MLDPKKLGIAGGIVWSLSLFVCTVLAMYTGYATDFLNVMISVYPGYSISWVGSIIGLAYGLADAFIGFYIIAWIYNKI